MRLFFAIAGNVGVGKSTLTERLSKTLGAKPFFEPQSENPYLADFYADMDRWAFHSQMFFLSRRLKEHVAMQREEGVIIQDRSLYENAEIFARHLHERGAITDRDWHIYQEIYETAVELLRPPDLVVYLRASVPCLAQRILSRGREFEKKIDEGYIGDLNRLYDEWAARFSRSPVVTIQTEELHYLTEPAHMDRVLDVIKQKLGGLPMTIFSSGGSSRS